MNKLHDIVLSPAQARAFEGLLNGICAGDVLLLKGCAGSGRTTILQKLQHATGGVLVGMREFMKTLGAQPPAAIEEAFLQMIQQALGNHEIISVDDLNLITQIATGCDYPRGFVLDAALTAIMGEAMALNKKLVFSTNVD